MATESSGKKTVLITGATGRVGKEVVARLAKEEGFIVRAATRDKASYATSLGAHETVTFDLEDKSTWGPAMEGVTHLFSSTQDKYVGSTPHDCLDWRVAAHFAECAWRPPSCVLLFPEPTRP